MLQLLVVFIVTSTVFLLLCCFVSSKSMFSLQYLDATGCSFESDTLLCLLLVIPQCYFLHYFQFKLLERLKFTFDATPSLKWLASCCHTIHIFIIPWKWCNFNFLPLFEFLLGNCGNWQDKKSKLNDWNWTWTLIFFFWPKSPKCLVNLNMKMQYKSNVRDDFVLKL